MADHDKLVKVVELNTSPRRVWEALTDYKVFGTWFQVKLDQPYEVGQKSTGRITYPGHEHIRWLVFVERMDKERLFSFRWYDTIEPGDEPADNDPALLVEFKLDETANGTRLTITESGFAALPDDRRDELIESNTEGWNIQAENIKRNLSRT